MCSSHVIDKRSLLGKRQAHGHGHHGHHQQHHDPQQHHIQNSFGGRVGRDGHNGQHESDNEIR